MDVVHVSSSHSNRQGNERASPPFVCADARGCIRVWQIRGADAAGQGAGGQRRGQAELQVSDRPAVCRRGHTLDAQTMTLRVRRPTAAPGGRLLVAIFCFFSAPLG